MASVIELFGAPGTGKSSTVRALEGRHVAGRRIVGADRLLRVARGRPFGSLLRRDLTPGERRRELAARGQDWAGLLSIVRDAPLGRDADDPLRPLHAPGWLAATLELRALADAAPADVVVVLDEGLVQRAPIVCGADPDDETLARYLRALPPPALHVHLTQDPAVLVARLRGRGRVIDRHVGLDDGRLIDSVRDDLRLLARCAAGLVAAGAAVHTTVPGEVDAVASGVLSAIERAL